MCCSCTFSVKKHFTTVHTTEQEKALVLSSIFATHSCDFLVRRGLFSLLDLLCPIALHVTLLMSTRSTSCEQASSPVLWLDNLHRCLHTPPFPSSICPRGLGPGRQGGREVETTKEKRGSTAEESRAGRLAWERGIRRQK